MTGWLGTAMMLGIIASLIALTAYVQWRRRRRTDQAMVARALDGPGINILDLSRARLRLAASRAIALCRGCTRQEACWRWYAKEGSDGPPPFCPNPKLVESYKASYPQATSDGDGSLPPPAA